MLQVTEIFPSPKLPRMELRPPREAEVEGVFRQSGSPFNGRIIYTETVFDPIETAKTKRVRIGPDGNEVWKKSPTGEPLYPFYDMEVKYRRKRYILVANEVARNVKKVENFEMSAEEIAEQKRKDASANFLQELVAAALDEGVSPADLVRKFKAEVAQGAGIPEDAVGIDLTEKAIAEVAASLDVDVLPRPEETDTVSVAPKGTARQRVGKARKAEAAE